MRIRRLDLTRYGRFTDASIDFGERAPDGPDLHIVYGLNEAGKSTALNAILDLLFGIEERSRYNFLHAYPAMEIGARLEFGGSAHDLVRRKQRAGSLLDAEGRAVNEALVAGALSGLGREAYRTMFSLDDETLEEGGNAILQSRGDLGELLFSASAGLGQVGALLARSAEEADGIYKKRARSTEIAGLKQRLAELKSRREALDTAASSYAALLQGAAVAASAYDGAMAERGRAKAALDRAARLAAARPEADLHRATAEALAAFEGLPRPPEGWARALPALAEAETRTATRIEAVRERMGALAREIDAAEPDDAALAAAAEIRDLAGTLGRYVTAEEDLPRRRAALSEREAGLAALLARLGQGGHADPAALVLAAPVTGTLRDLVEAHPVIEARLRTAERELAEADDRLDTVRRASERRLDAGPGAGPDAGPETGEAALAALEAVLRRLRRSDAALRLDLARRALPEARRRAGEALAALAPFSGGAEALEALAPPPPRRMEAWRAGVADLDRRRSQHRERAREHRAEAGAATARLAALREASGPIDDAEAARLRAVRDAAWAAHRATLDEAGADAFRAALDADDRIVEARLARTRDLAELRQETQRLGVAEAGIAAQERFLAELAADGEALAGEIRAAAPFAPAGGDASGTLDGIEAFGQRRAAALDAASAARDAEATAADAEAEVEAERRDLAEALRRCGERAEASDVARLADLVEVADTLLARSKAERADAASAQKALSEAEAAILRRRRELDAAEAELGRWQTRWDGALAGGWIDPAQPVGAVREILETLATLAPALRERDDLGHRIAAMTADQGQLVRRLQAIQAALGEPPGAAEPRAAVAALAERLAAAERTAERLAVQRAELEAEASKGRALEEERRVNAAAKAEMTALFGVETLAEVGAALERSAERLRLERRLAELGASLVLAMRTPDAEAAVETLLALDMADIEREAGELGARHEDLDQRTRALFAERTKAADALAAVGGDDAVARLQVERQTVLMEIEEAAQRYLRLRAGTLVAEGALRAYRDRHRSTMMARASQAFQAMTRGDYAGLSARPEKDRETLIGLPRQGGSKLATDMSKGTRFQLYLALRLAGYEEFAAARRPVPFLADDIMETFDEPRSQEVLRLFAGMARIGQVVYFTHHRHLCDIAAAVEPGVRIHRI